MNRAKIEDTLLVMGVPAGIRGFTYIVDAIEEIEKIGINISMTKELYPNVALKNGTKDKTVERGIRHALEVCRKGNGDRGKINHYIGFINCEVSSSLKQLYMMLKREEA